MTGQRLSRDSRRVGDAVKSLLNVLLKRVGHSRIELRISPETLPFRENPDKDVTKSRSHGYLCDILLRRNMAGAPHTANKAAVEKAHTN